MMNIKSEVAQQYLGVLASLDQLSGDKRSMVLLRHGTLTVQLYAPQGKDDQHPHEKDEIYVIASGTGKLQRDGDEVTFGPGDVLFVPAGEKHKFVKFSDDFATWVFLYGPDGGEGNVENKRLIFCAARSNVGSADDASACPAYAGGMKERELIATQREKEYVVAGRCSVCIRPFDSPIHSALRASNQVVRDFENHVCSTDADQAAARIVRELTESRE